MPSEGLQALGREKLAQLGREYMQAAQLNSRTGYAALRMNHGDEAYREVAIDNWMAASPVYTRRMQPSSSMRKHLNRQAPWINLKASPVSMAQTFMVCLATKIQSH